MSKNIIGFDRTGALYEGRENMNSAKQEYASRTNPNKASGSQRKHRECRSVHWASLGNINSEDVSKMADKAIVFAMSNPTPEIMPEDAYPHVAVMQQLQ